jgi:hypothetical protein
VGVHQSAEQMASHGLLSLVAILRKLWYMLKQVFFTLIAFAGDNNLLNIFTIKT